MTDTSATQTPAPADTARAPWLALIGADLPVDAEALFPETEGMFVKRANVKRAKLVAALEDVLKVALEDDERVRYAAQGVLYNGVEFYFSGYVAATHSNRTALVITDRRILMINASASGKPRDIKNQIRLDRLMRAKRAGMFGSYFRFELADGKKIMFMGIARRDKKVFTAMIPNHPKAPPIKNAGVEHLCPRCMKVVEGKAGSIPSCPHADCGIPFRNAKKAAAWSLLVPGIGDLYLRHFLFGTFELIGSTVALAVATPLILNAFFSGTSEDVVAAIIIAGMFVILPRVIDYPLTLHMGRKGIVPLSMDPVNALPDGVRGPGLRIHKPLPSFPLWARGLIGVSVLLIVVQIALLLPEARASAVLGQARVAAEAGDYESALALWEQAKEGGVATDEGAGRLARALYRSGDLDGGDQIVDYLDGRPITDAVANDINATIDTYAQKIGQYTEGVRLLVEGNDEQAWAKIDPVIVYFAQIKRPALPKNRNRVRVETARNLLGAPLYESDFIAAQRVLAGLDGELDDPEHRICQARIALVSGKLKFATKQLQGVAYDSIEPQAVLLALETRVPLAKGVAEFNAIATEARQIEPSELDEHNQARRVALAAINGEAPAAPPAIRELAAQIADAEGWGKATSSLTVAAR